MFGYVDHSSRGFMYQVMLWKWNTTKYQRTFSIGNSLKENVPVINEVNPFVTVWRIRLMHSSWMIQIGNLTLSTQTSGDLSLRKEIIIFWQSAISMAKKKQLKRKRQSVIEDSPECAYSECNQRFIVIHIKRHMVTGNRNYHACQVITNLLHMPL